MGPAVYSVTLNGAPAAASPQVNEFWVDRRLSAHPLHREEALGGAGAGAATQSWVEGGGGRRPERGPAGVCPSPRGRPQDGPWPLCLSVPGIPGAPAGRASCPVWATSARLQGERPEVRTALAPKTTQSHLVPSCACAKADARGPGGSPPPESLPLLLALRAL